MRQLQQRLRANLPPQALELNDTFRKRALYNADIDILLKPHLRALQDLHKTYAKPKPGATHTVLMNTTEFLSCLQDAKLFDQNFTQFDAKLAFQQSLMNVADQNKRRLQTVTLTFTDFLEALARVSVSKKFPTEDMIAESESDNLLEYYAKMEAKKKKKKKGAKHISHSTGTMGLELPFFNTEMQEQQNAEPLYICLKKLMLMLNLSPPKVSG